jgi:hypothetical protein
MLGDLTEKVQGSQNKFEELVAKIPGYAGYKKKEQRREADKLLRLHVARLYDAQLQRLNGVQYALTDQGKLKAMMTLERASIKLQLLVDRIKTASYGYAGLFDAVKVDEAALDRLYDFDEQMLAGVDTVKGLLDQLEAAAAQEEDAGSLSVELVSLIEALNTAFSQRQDIILQ